MNTDCTLIEPKAYRVSEFLRHYVISKSSFYREVNARRLQTYKRGRTTLIARAEAERWYSHLPRSRLQESISSKDISMHTKKRIPNIDESVSASF